MFSKIFDVFYNALPFFIGYLIANEVLPEEYSSFGIFIASIIGSIIRPMLMFIPIKIWGTQGSWPGFWSIYTASDALKAKSLLVILSLIWCLLDYFGLIGIVAANFIFAVILGTVYEKLEDHFLNN